MHGLETTRAAWRKRDLSPPRQALIEFFHRIGFGEIRNLRVRDGEPELDPHPEIVCDVVLGRNETPNPASGKSDFALKREQRDLFAKFDEDRNLDIERIVVQAGLPIRMRLRVPSAE